MNVVRFPVERTRRGSGAPLVQGNLALKERAGNFLGPQPPHFESPHHENAMVQFPDGTQARLDSTNGRTLSIRDLNENEITITPNAITHQSGVGITIARDAEGRVTGILDPDGKSLVYDYSGAGDLSAFTNRESARTSFAYDDRHLLTSITDARGVELLVNSYDDTGRLIGQTDASGASMSFDHDIANFTERITDRLGAVTTHVYDDRGNVVRTADAQGGTRSFTHDDFDNRLTETNEFGDVTRFTYDDRDQMTSTTDPLGNITRFEYNAFGSVTKTTDPLGRVTENFYDSKGNLIRTQNPDGTITTRGYEAGQLTSEVDPLGNPTSHSYDFFSGGHLTSTTDALGHATTFTNTPMGLRRTEARTRTLPGGGQQTLTTTFFYDGEGRVTSTVSPDGERVRTEFNALGQEAARIDQRGNRTEMTYDDQGRLTATTYAVGTPQQAVERTEFDAEGRRTASVDRAGRRTEYRYDSLGRLVRTTFADATFTSTEFDSAGRVRASIDARGARTEFGYDSAGRRIFARDAEGRISSFAFDAVGNLTAETDPAGRVTLHFFDSMNRETGTLFADGTMRRTEFDSAGRRIATIDEAGKRTDFGYDALGRLTSVRDAEGGVTEYRYDEVSNLIEQEDALNRVTRFEFDQVGRRTARVLPLGQRESFEFDAAGNRTAHVKFGGERIGFSYDPLNRLTTKTYPDLSTVAYTYSPTGRRETMTDPTGLYRWTYDQRDRVLTKESPLGTLTYTHDPNGNLLTLRSNHSSGADVTYRYDTLNRLFEAEDARLGITRYTFDQPGNLATLTYPNSVATTYTYNDRNRLTNIQTTRGGTPIARYTYTLGAAGNRLTVSELSGRAITWTYDDLYRLTSEQVSNATPQGSVSYNLDAVGNRLSRISTLAGVPTTSSTFDANDRPTGSAFDANGNQTEGGYGFDFDDRLVSRSGASPVVITYNGDGERISEVVNGTTTYYLVDSLNPTGFSQVVEELSGPSTAALTLSKVYTYGLDLIAQRDATTSAARFYIHDGQGSVRILTDGSGTTTDAIDYDVFGSILSRTGTTQSPYQFHGEWFDEDLGLYHLRARYYDAGSSRFLGLDSFDGRREDPISLHRYLGFGADGINKFDPNGLEYTVGDQLAATAIISTLANIAVVSYSFGNVAASGGPAKGFIIGIEPITAGSGGLAFGLGFQILADFSTGNVWVYSGFDFSITPNTVNPANAVTASASVSLAYYNDAGDFDGSSVSATLPLAVFTRPFVETIIGGAGFKRIADKLVFGPVRGRAALLVGAGIGNNSAYFGLSYAPNTLATTYGFNFDRALIDNFPPLKQAYDNTIRPWLSGISLNSNTKDLEDVPPITVQY